MQNISLDNLPEYKGKKLMKSYQNALKKIHALGVRVPESGGVRTNPFSGVSRELEPLAVALYDFIILQYKAGNVGKLFPVSVWDSARYTFMTLWPEEYYDLID